MKDSKKEYPSKWVILPKKFPDLSAKAKECNLKVDKIHAIIHLYLTIKWRMERNTNYAPALDRKAGWVPISSETLRRIAAKHYNKYVDFLVQNGLLEIRLNEGTLNPTYQNGKYTMLYRIPAIHFSKSKKRRYRRVLITDRTTLKAIQRFKDTSREKSVEKLLAREDHPQYMPLIEYSGQLRLDETAIERDYLAGKFEGKMRHEYMMLAHEFNTGNFGYAKVDEFGERLHHPLTRLPRELRDYLYCEGKPNELLCEIDIKNSQPYHLSLLMVKPDLINNYVNEFMFLKPSFRRYCDKTDVWHFNYMCSIGEIYNLWINFRLDKKDIKSCSQDKLKKIAKRELFGPVMFGRVESLSKNEGYRKYLKKIKFYFRFIYPNVWNLLSEIKRARSFIGFDGVEYKVVACIAQRFESRMIIKSIAPLLLINGIQGVTTIHDSFVLPLSDAENAKQVIWKHYQDLGIKPPTVTIKPYKKGQD